MGFFLRNKQQIKKFVQALVLVVVLAVPRQFSIAANGTAISAGLDAEKALKQQQLAELQRQINQLQGQIQDTEKQKSSLKNELVLFDAQIRETTLQIRAAQTNIDNTQIQITETKSQIQTKTQQIAQEKEMLAQLIATLDEYQQSSGIQLALGSGHFSDFLDQIQYATTVENKVFNLVEEIKNLKKKLEQDQLVLQDNLDRLDQQQQALQQTQQILSDQRSQKETLLTQTKGREANFQKLLASSEDQQAKINQEINDLDRQIQSKKGFNSLKPIHGILDYPMDGVMTQGYGNTGFTKLGYDFHNGIDIAAPAGSTISAAADGVVYATGRGQAAYGNWVVVKHTITAAGGHQIMTLYAHMRAFVVSPGQPVKAGDLIGYEGNTGNTTRLLCNCPDRGYHLHFTVFDATDFGIKDGAYPNIYGSYQIPYGFTYNPLDFL